MTTEHKPRNYKRAFAAGVLTGAAASFAIKTIAERKRTTRTGMRIEAWALRAKSEILGKMADMEDMTEREFKTIVDAITSKYGEIDRINAEKVREIAREFKSRWKEMKAAAEEDAEDDT